MNMGPIFHSFTTCPEKQISKVLKKHILLSNGNIWTIYYHLRAICVFFFVFFLNLLRSHRIRLFIISRYSVVPKCKNTWRKLVNKIILGPALLY